MRKFVLLLLSTLLFLQSCSSYSESNDKTSTVVSEVSKADYQAWQLHFRYAYVQSNTSTLMTAGFSLESNQKAVLYRSGSELLAWNQGQAVTGNYEIFSYEKAEKVESYGITEPATRTVEEPERVKVLPEVQIEIDIPEDELKKANANHQGKQQEVFYGYKTEDNVYVLTNGKSGDDLRVFLTSLPTTKQMKETIFPKGLLGTWYGLDFNNLAVYSRTFYESGLVETKLPDGQVRASMVAELIEVDEQLYRYELQSQDNGGVFYGNIGGAGVKYDFGLYISPDEQYIEPVLFSALADEEFDYKHDSVESAVSMKMYRDLERLRHEEGERFKTDGNFLGSDTKNLSTEEVIDWVWRNYSLGMGTPDYSFYTDQGWSVTVWKNQEDGLVYADILDNREQIIWNFRINQDGNLQTNKGYGSGLKIEWTTVAENLSDSGRGSQ